jgi:AcrR family transcriptional regulator
MPKPPTTKAAPKAAPAPAPRRRDRAATEEALLDAAERVVARDGFAALNVRAIAAEAGVDRKLVYRYFGDADGVLARLGAREERWGGKRASAPIATTYADAMVALLRDYARDLGRDDTLQRMLAWELTGSSDALTGLDRARSAAMRSRMDTMRGALRPPPDVDAPAVIAVALAALHYLTLRQRTLGSFAGVTLDAKGMRRAMAVIERMVARELGSA